MAEFGWADTWPIKLLQQLGQAATLPGDRWAGRAPLASLGGMPGSTPPDDFEGLANLGRATDLAGVVMGGGYGAAEKGAVGIFGGRLAATADHKALSVAEELARKGASRSEIWEKTGWFQGADGKWRFEIDDSSARLNPNRFGYEASQWNPSSYNAGGLPLEGERGLVAGQVWHKDLYDAYPQLRALDAKVQDGNNSGRFFPPNYSGAASLEVNATNPATGRSIALHELQHAVQDVEGFAKGSPAKAGTEAYTRSAGEEEAFNVQRRAFMDAAERQQVPPFVTEKIPTSRQQVNMNYQGPPDSLASILGRYLFAPAESRGF